MPSNYYTNFLNKASALACTVEWLSEADIEFIRNQAKHQTSSSNPLETLNTIVDICKNNITLDSANFQYIANMFLQWSIRLQVIGSIDDMPTPQDWYEKNRAIYNPCLDKYTDEEWGTINSFIDHSRDMNMTLFGGNKYKSVFLLQDRQTGEIQETPQIALLLLAASLCIDEDESVRLRAIKDLYDACSLGYISLATPIMCGMRSRLYKYASCILLDIDDTIDSISEGLTKSIMYSVQKAGLGLNLGRIRGIGSKIRDGQAIHTGNTLYYRMFQSAIQACHRGGIRNGAATTFFPIWHREIVTLVSLKNNRNTESHSVRHMDHTVQIRDVFYKRLQRNENITLFSPHEVTDLYEAFFTADEETFTKLYEEKENNPDLEKSTIPAVELFVHISNERAQTGRIYIQNVDHCSSHSSFDTKVAPIHGSNLCVEVTLPTSPLSYKDKGQGEVGQCVLGAVNLGRCDTATLIKHYTAILVRTLDSVISATDYGDDIPLKKGGLLRRSIGIGVNNLAYAFAKESCEYGSDKSLQITHRIFEALQWSAIKESTKLAQEKGKCPLFNQTKYSDGLLPIDHYSKAVDSLGEFNLECDWDQLRRDVQAHGMRNSTLTAVMPSEVSSSTIGATNGIEPIRSHVVVKQSPHGSAVFVVPEAVKLYDNYSVCWNMLNARYLKVVGVIQKFIDQAVSTNCYYNTNHYQNKKVSVQSVLKDMLLAYKLGIKTLYYHNTSDEVIASAGCERCKL